MEKNVLSEYNASYINDLETELINHVPFDMREEYWFSIADAKQDYYVKMGDEPLVDMYVTYLKIITSFAKKLYSNNDDLVKILRGEQ